MKKLDEIMELMADEMQDFQNGLLQMKKMTDDLNTRSIPITTEVLEKQLKFFFQQQQEKEAIAAERLTAINIKLKNAYILPKNLGMILGSLLILLVSLIGYLSFELITFKDEKFENHQSREYDIFFEGYPEQKEIFDQWLQNHDIP
ncbi:DUF6730 family protein [Salinimicrobium sp. CAU 1759]